MGLELGLGRLRPTYNVLGRVGPRQAAMRAQDGCNGSRALSRFVASFESSRPWKLGSDEANAELSHLGPEFERILDNFSKMPGLVFPLPPHLMLLPWGFLSQKSVADRVAKDHEANMHTKIKTEVYPGSVSEEALIPDVVGSTEELVEGVEQSYLFLAKKFNEFHENQFNWADLDICAPVLAERFELLCIAYKVVNLTPKIEIAGSNLKADLLNIWIEAGTASDRKKPFFGMTMSEARYHLLSGVLGPEFSASSGSTVLGHPPRRLCAAFKIKSREKFSIDGELLDIATLKPNEVNAVTEWMEAEHFLVFESDWRVEEPTQWRLRNMNDSFQVNEGEKLPWREAAPAGH